VKELTKAFKMRFLPVRFNGTVHCEASLMGMIVRYKDRMSPLPKGMKCEELDAWKVLPNCIGYES